MLTAELGWLVEPEKVPVVHPSSHPLHDSNEVLIKWRGLPDFEASWESVDLISKQFPNFHLEDKVFSKTGGTDRYPKPPIQYTYNRRKKKGGDHGTGIM